MRAFYWMAFLYNRPQTYKLEPNIWHNTATYYLILYSIDTTEMAYTEFVMKKYREIIEWKLIYTVHLLDWTRGRLFKGGLAQTLG
jgi:hypothetical protein